MTTDAVSSIRIRRATVADAARLAALSASTFTETFAADNTPEDMAAYLAQTYGEETQRAELQDPRVTVYFAEQGQETLGYVMLREGPAPAGVGGASSLEIARLYASERWIGAGVGAALMRHSLHEAAARGRESVWLGVWEHNHRALGFYRRWRFTDVGSKPFLVGTDLQTDRLMARPVIAEG
jgi:ribosomal protein S18 acetylase RimI-like enzyme